MNLEGLKIWDKCSNYPIIQGGIVFVHIIQLKHHLILQKL